MALMNPAHDAATQNGEQNRGRQKSPAEGPNFFWCSVSPSRGTCVCGSESWHARRIADRAFSYAVFVLTGPSTPVGLESGEVCALGDSDGGGGIGGTGAGGGGGGGANGPARGDRPVASPCTPPLPLTVNRPKSANASLAKAGGIWCAVVGESRSAIPPGDARRSGIGTSACNDPLDEPFVAANDSRRSLAVLAAALASVASARDRSTAASLARSSSLTA
mmetsp:Transcript_7962/g.26447  ORF Transcript_7962/g.26447 Transcript_7962/m.26447 type:complete len:220 (+) Transcript_7962:763-1422(+)